MTRSYYSSSISNFLKDDENYIFGLLCQNYNYDINDLTKIAWKAQIKILKSTLKEFTRGQIYFEFSIPRMGKRVDNILIIDDFIFVVEFKVGSSKYTFRELI